jgi:hypothetical protein
MTILNLMVYRHSAFYSPILSAIAGGFLAQQLRSVARIAACYDCSVFACAILSGALPNSCSVRSFTST